MRHLSARWHAELRDDLHRRAQADLLRRLEPTVQTGRMVQRNGHLLVNVGSNDYLGLSHHPHLIAAATLALQTHGTGSGASRLVTGHSPLHAAIEDRFATFKGQEAALLFPSGYTANIAVLTSLPRRGDLICIDKLNHASLVEAAQQSRATCRVYPHGCFAKLERLLSRHHTTSEDSAQRYIVTDTVFSMDGDVAPLQTLCSIAQRYQAILIVDEAHATGVLGPRGAGLVEHLGVAAHADVVVSTASKALGGMGGIVTAPRIVVEALINRASPFIYTTAPPAAQVATISAALDLIRDEPWRRRRLAETSSRLRDSLRQIPWLSGSAHDPDPQTPIIPLVVGDAHLALELQEYLAERGFFAPAIRPPTVPPGSSRVRLSLRADLTDHDLESLAKVIADWQPPRPLT